MNKGNYLYLPSILKRVSLNCNHESGMREYVNNTEYCHDCNAKFGEISSEEDCSDFIMGFIVVFFTIVIPFVIMFSAPR